VRKKYFVQGRLEHPRQNKNLFYRHDKPNEPTKKVPLSFVLFESLFASVSTIEKRRGARLSAQVELSRSFAWEGVEGAMQLVKRPG
jgi:hypothetical protein